MTLRNQMSDIPRKGYLTLAHAADYLDLPPSTLREYVRLRKIRAFKPGKNVLFRIRELDQWVESHRLTTPPLR